MTKVTIYTVDWDWTDGLCLYSAVAEDLPKTYRVLERTHGFHWQKLIPKLKSEIHTDPQDAIDYYIESQQMKIGTLEERILTCRKNIQAAEELVVPEEEG